MPVLQPSRPPSLALKLLYIATWFPYPVDNGSKHRVYQLLRALGRRHDLTLLSFAFGPLPPDPDHLLQTCCRRVEIVPHNPFQRGLAWKLRFFRLQPVASRPVPAMTRRMQQLLAHTRYDAVIASTTVTAAYALQSQSGARILEEHNSHRRWAAERLHAQTTPMARAQAWLSWQKVRRYEAHLYPRFDLCTAVSEADQQAMLAAFPGRQGPVEMVPNGVDCDHNRPGLARPAPQSLVYSGALSYHANYDAMCFFLADILPLLRREAPAVRLTITGAYDGVDRGGLALDDSVRLSGYVEDVRPLIAGATVCIVPLRHGGGTRLKILEAMALGTPVVSTSKGAEGLDVRADEHLLIADEPADFARATLRLLHDESLRRQLSQNARRLVEERYDWRALGERFCALVEGAAERARRRML